MEEYKLGEVFQFGKIKLKCVQSSSSNCYRCILEKFDNCDYFIGDCDEFHRSDKKNVIFIEVKEEDNGIPVW